MKTRIAIYLLAVLFLGLVLCSCNSDEKDADLKDNTMDKPTTSENVGWGRNDKQGSEDTQKTPFDKKSADDNKIENDDDNEKSDDENNKEDEADMDKKKGFAPTPTAAAKDKKQTASPTKTPSNKR